jgi:glycosyltransferase involved in cell wall biosynthesis
MALTAGTVVRDLQQFAERSAANCFWYNAYVAQNKVLPAKDRTVIPEVSVVMPAYNEEAALPDVLDEATAALDALSARWELIVVDDGSTDSTPQILRDRAASDERIRVLTQHGNLGYGMALRRGFDAARHLVVAYTDADGQLDLRDLGALYPFLRDFDMVVGYRVGRRDSGGRRFASKVYNVLATTILGFRARDINCALKMFRSSFLYMIDLTSSDFLIDAELFVRAKRAGLRWAEVGVTHRPREGGSSTVRYGLAWPVLRGLLGLRRSG